MKLILGTSSALAQEGTFVQDSAKTRAEVRADLQMWRRAGLLGLHGSEGFDPASPEVQQRMAEYSRLRAGPEYQAELRRQEGSDPTASMAAGPAPATSN